MKPKQQLFEDIRKFVEENKSLLSKGGSVEVTGLDTKVQKLCEDILKLPDDESSAYADSLQILLTELTILGEDLMVQKEALAHEIRYLSSHKKASVAYKIADAKAPLDENE